MQRAYLLECTFGSFYMKGQQDVYILKLALRVNMLGKAQ